MKTQEQKPILSYDETMRRIEENVDDSYLTLLRNLTENQDLTEEQRETLIKLLLIMNQIQLALKTDESGKETGDETNPDRPTYKETLREVDSFLNNARGSLMSALIHGDLTTQERENLSSVSMDLLDIAHKMVDFLHE
jgi:hypothetical protein